MTTITPYRSDQRAGPDGFAQLLHAEWTKFRTVRGWVIGMIVAVMVAAGIGLLGTGTSSSSCQHVGGGPTRSGAGCMPTFPLGPGGEPVGEIPPHVPLVHHPGQPAGARQHAQQRQLGQRHRG